MLGLFGILASGVRDSAVNVVEQSTQAVGVAYPQVIALSMLMLVVAFFAARCRKIALGPSLGRSFNHATLTLGVFMAVLFFNLALSTYGNLPPLEAFFGKVFDTLQMMLAGKEMLTFAPGSMGLGHDGLVFYELFIYLVAPITTFFDLATLFTGTTSRLKAMWYSIHRDTYLITPLGEQTLVLANSICKKYEAVAKSGGEKSLTHKANIVFTDCSKDEKASFVGRAYDIGAICVRQTMEKMVNEVSKRHKIYVMFDGGGVSDHARAMSTYKRLQRFGNSCGNYVYLFSPLANAGELLPSRVASDGDVSIRLVDWTRSLVESTLDRYPLFLLNTSPNLAGKLKNAHEEEAETEGAGQGEGEPSIAYSPSFELQQKMLESDSRHVVIVGGGHVGMEFLKAAIAYSQMGDISFWFDVVDSAPDLDDERCHNARSLLRTSVPDMLNGKVRDAVTFHNIDARSKQYERFLMSNAPTITYVFVALGKDTLTADTAIRTRRILERGILRDCMGKGDTKERESEYGERCRAVIVAVIDDDGLGKELLAASSMDLSQRIDVVGSREQMFSFESMKIADQRETSYKSRSAHASKQHAKYKMFSFARSMRGQQGLDISALEIDWKRDFREVLRLGESSDTLDAILIYNKYCETSKMLENESDYNHEWLLRIEHNRWCAFARAEGLNTPTLNELQTYASVFCNDNDTYRCDEAGLHACLVAFDDLPQTYERWKEVFESKLGDNCTGNTTSVVGFQERNDMHIRVEPKEI